MELAEWESTDEMDKNEIVNTQTSPFFVPSYYIFLCFVSFLSHIFSFRFGFQSQWSLSSFCHKQHDYILHYFANKEGGMVLKWNFRGFIYLLILWLNCLLDKYWNRLKPSWQLLASHWFIFFCSKIFCQI